MTGEIVIFNRKSIQADRFLMVIENNSDTSSRAEEDAS
jgi:hypothetical protein